MASNLGNLIVPSVFGRYVGSERDKLNAFVKSGAAVATPALSGLLAGGANVFNLPFWGNISATAVVPSTDYAVEATPQKMAASSQKALRMLRAITPVAITDLEGMLIGDDPVVEAARQVAETQNEIRQSILISMLDAVTAADTAALTFDAGVATALTGAMIVEAVATKFGDQARGLAGLTLVMNSMEYFDLQSSNLTSGVNVVLPNAIDVGFGTFLGATLVIDDTVAANTVYVIKRGGLAFGQASVATPVEIERKANAGNAGGADFLYARDLFTYHVAGTSYSGSVAGDLASDAEIALAGNWDLVKAAKLCGAFKLIHD